VPEGLEEKVPASPYTRERLSVAVVTASTSMAGVLPRLGLDTTGGR
jgi:hypothetical protein